MSKEKEDPPDFVTREMCDVKMGAAVEKLSMEVKLLEEKFKGLYNALKLGFTVTTIIIVVVEFLLRFS